MINMIQEVNANDQNGSFKTSKETYSNNKSEERQKNIKRLEILIEMEDGRLEIIQMNEDEDPKLVAERFCSIHNIKLKLADIFKTILILKFQELLQIMNSNEENNKIDKNEIKSNPMIHNINDEASCINLSETVLTKENKFDKKVIDITNNPQINEENLSQTKDNESPSFCKHNTPRLTKPCDSKPEFQLYSTIDSKLVTMNYNHSFTVK